MSFLTEPMKALGSQQHILNCGSDSAEGLAHVAVVPERSEWRV